MSILRNRHTIFISRVSIAFVLICAGFIKLIDLENSVQSVGSYQLLSADLSRLVGTWLPVGEVILGLLILFNIFKPFVNYIAAVLMLAFILIIISVWARGLSIDCGCFGGGGELPSEGKELRYVKDILRDLGFFSLAIISSFRANSIKNELVGNELEVENGLGMEDNKSNLESSVINNLPEIL